MIKKFKIFINPTVGITNWLNKMSNSGFRLLKTGNIFFYFEKCEKGKYKYAVDYVANKSYEELKDYEEFLKRMGIRSIEKPASIGKMSKWNVRYRPFADKGARIATSNGMIKREYLCLEKINDGKPFEIYSDLDSKINAIKNMRKPVLSGAIFLGILIFTLETGILPVYNKSLVEFNLLSNLWSKDFISLIVFGGIELILVFRVIQITFKINSLKKQRILGE